ncbi:MAG: 2-polyprenyl-3-methyl-6-methoxy-1,4-benzoquinone monooxygenase [Sinobacteraceae bacterium]|nr:2-polyprenyl-3-methyl-6-methoxy-1,4-benzoquinone monooxygenase [Nevskiaceae bacterium]
MESRYPLDPFIAAADRALRALFAPAHASRPVPDASPVADPPSSGGPSARSQPIGPHAVDSQPTAGPAPQSADFRPAPDLAPHAAGLHQGPNVGQDAGATSQPRPNTPPALSDTERRESAALMRVNHAGEIAAQALYHGQALVSRSAATQEILLKAAREESDHLAWCETRLKELGSRPSLLNPLWYCGSFAIGVLAAAAGDRASLGFVVETERQVEGHLNDHLTRLPSGDTRSRAILDVMRTDEIVHGATAKAAGASELPAPVRVLMRQVARVMTTTAYWI